MKQTKVNIETLTSGTRFGLRNLDSRSHYHQHHHHHSHYHSQQRHNRHMHIQTRTKQQCIHIQNPSHTIIEEKNKPIGQSEPSENSSSSDISISPTKHSSTYQPDATIDTIQSSWSVSRASVWHRDPVEDYKMSSAQRGICLIINNVQFDIDMLPKRKGSDMDAFRFKEIFKQLGFLVESKRNLASDKMRATFKQVSARCMTKHDALVIILLSHGTESGIYGTDGLEVEMNDILTYFDNKKCKQMMGKPKVFIVQACRGRLADYGVKDTQTFFSQPESQTFTEPSQLTQMNTDTPRISRWSEVDRDFHPTRTDMVLCFSCHTGYVSTRNEEEGSWLGASLALHLQKEARQRHLIEILNMVSRDVRRRKSTDGHKQVLEITSIGFDRNLYFNPGLFEGNGIA